MKFAFVENRYKTIFWTAISRELKALGHQSTWLVQNPVFTPDEDSVHLIPFPKKKDLAVPPGNIPNELLWARDGDRFINYFGGNHRHYSYYQREISKWLDIQKPTVVIGESTLFHEFIVIQECSRRGIPYFHPSMPGYPGGRFSVYAYNTKKPLAYNKNVPDDEHCLALAEAIRKREKIPDYMTPSSGTEPERNHPLPRSIKDRLTILRGYLRGERYNTPSPWRKLLLDQSVKRRLATWERIAYAKKPPEGKRFVLYPLQMQPEANLDVWGQRFRNQSKLIYNIADHMPQSWHLLVKANPKAKYELSSELIDILNRNPRVSPVSLYKSMSDALERASLVCTVTGTVAVECVLSLKPVVQLGPGIVEDGVGCALLSDVADIPHIMRQVEDNKFSAASESQRIALIRNLYRTTFPGRISDPVNLPAAMTQDNVITVTHTLLQVAEKCTHPQS